MQKKFKIIFISVASALLILFLASTFYIEWRVQVCCRNAIEQFGGDEVDALLAFVESEEYCTEKKACALWALGQLGAEEALPFLRENYEDPVNRNLCVHEAQFAIEKISEKRFNLPGFLWRGFF